MKKTEFENDDLKRKRKNAVRTALVLAAVAVAVFVTFVGSAVLDH